MLTSSRIQGPQLSASEILPGPIEPTGPPTSVDLNLQERFALVRGFTEQLCEPLETEDFVVQSMPDVSPTKWHLAHTTWFFERFILTDHYRRVVGREYTPVHSAYDYLFNSYYNTIGPQHCRPRRGLLSRPTVSEVLDYRHEVNDRLLGLLDAADDAQLARLTSLVTLGCHHEQQHQELLVTDLKHVFSSNPMLPAYRSSSNNAADAHDALQPNGRTTFEGGLQEMGLAAEGSAFHFDNETPRHRVWVEPFALDRRLVTNAEFAEFIADHGYARPELWLSLGYATVQAQGWKAPLYWFRAEGASRDEAWQQYTMHGPEVVNADEPVSHLSYFEADAYARWAGARLPTEAQWELAARDQPVAGHFADQLDFHARSANAGCFGTVWEWTASPYQPYPGYVPLPGALGEYNGKFMCNQYVLRGGSVATHSTHFRLPYRNFFGPDARWQFTGLRLAWDA